MISLTILTILALLLIIGLAIVLLSYGVAFIVVFGDIIVCVLIVALIVKHFIKKRKNKK